MAAIAADRNLLFGLLALQNGLINQVQLVATFQAWTLDRARALADHFIALGHLNQAQRAVVEAMAELHVAKHRDIERSLVAISAGRSTHESLAQIGDPQIHATSARLGSALTDHHQHADADFDRTASYEPGRHALLPPDRAASARGRRYRRGLAQNPAGRVSAAAADRPTDCSGKGWTPVAVMMKTSWPPFPGKRHNRFVRNDGLACLKLRV
jgi:hypothetical protein